jgi:hypothetical protein
MISQRGAPVVPPAAALPQVDALTSKSSFPLHFLCNAVDAPCSFVFQNPDHQVVLPTVASDVAFGLGRWAGAGLALQTGLLDPFGQPGQPERGSDAS